MRCELDRGTERGRGGCIWRQVESSGREGWRRSLAVESTERQAKEHVLHPVGISDWGSGAAGHRSSTCGSSDSPSAAFSAQREPESLVSFCVVWVP